MKINTIYQQGNFEFNQNYSIKIEEKTISLNQNLESLQLLSQNTITHHRKKFNYLHIRLVQLAIKPLFRLGLDIPVFVCLRDARSTRFTDSILSMIDLNLTNGTVVDHFFRLPHELAEHWIFLEWGPVSE